MPGVRASKDQDMKKLISLLAISLFSMHSYAASFRTIEEAEEKLAQAMGHMDKLEIEQGFSALKPYWPLPGQEIDSVIYKTNQQLPLIKERFGQPLGSEKACVQSIGDSWVRVTYLQKFEKHTMLWKAEFYKPKEAWVLNGFAFHDQWQTLFEQNCSNK